MPMPVGRRTYRESVTCVFCKRSFVITRRRTSQGMMVETHCPYCKQHFRSIAGKPEG